MQHSLTGTFPPFDASMFRVGLVVAQFNQDITAELLHSAQAELDRYRVPTKNITVIPVAGCIEIPVVLQALAATKQYDCLIAIGAVIRGDTPHFEYVCQIAADGVREVMLAHTIPVGFGILTLENKNQAASRLESGASAVTAALQANLTIKKIKNQNTKIA